MPTKWKYVLITKGDVIPIALVAGVVSFLYGFAMADTNHHSVLATALVWAGVLLIAASLISGLSITKK